MAWRMPSASNLSAAGEFRQIAPRRARPQDPEDAIDDKQVVYAGNAARFVGEHRFDDAPFAVAEFMAHDSKLHFGSLNHAQDWKSMAEQHVCFWRADRTYPGRRATDARDPNRTSATVARARILGRPPFNAIRPQFAKARVASRTPSPQPATTVASVELIESISSQASGVSAYDPTAPE